jgi:hypothetical protein
MRRLLTIWLTLCSIGAWATACPSTYAARYAIVVPHQSVPSNLTGFLVPLCFNGLCQNSTTLPTLKAVGSGGLVQHTAANTAGVTGAADVWFCDAAASGNLIKFENSYYDGITGKGIWWYQKNLSSSVDNYVYMFVGNASISTSQQDLSMWNDAGYLWVIHGSDPSTVSMAESVGFLGTQTNSSVTTTSGPLGGAFVFSSARLRYGHSNSIDTTGAWAYEQWLNPTSTSTQIIQDNGNDNGCSTPAILSALVTSNSLQTDACYSSADHGVISTTKVSTNKWTYAVGGTNGTTFRSYLNGVADATTANFSSPYSVSADDLYIGRTSGNNLSYAGKMFELRKSNQIYSADWYKTNYYAMVSPSGFNIVIDMSTPTGLTSGAYCIPITIDHTKVPTTDVTNMQVLVRGQYPWMATIANGGLSANSNLYDIRYYSNNTCTSLLPFERVYASATTGDSAWRVLLPTVSHTVDTVFYVSIGNAAFNSDAQNVSGTWPSPWIGVYHLGSPTSVILTSSGTDAITMSSSGSPTAVVTPLGGGISCNNGTSDTIGFTALNADTISSHGYPITSAVRHISCWAAIPVSADCTNDCTLFGWGKSNTVGDLGGYVLQNEIRAANTTDVVGMASNAGFSTVVGSQLFSQNGSTPTIPLQDFAWHKIEHDFPTAAGATTTGTVTIDGVSVTTPGTTGAASVLNTANGSTLGVDQAEVRVCRDPGHGAGFATAYIADCTATSATIGADERTARYNNEAFPYLFYSFGAGTPVSGTTNKIGNVVYY